MAGFKTFMHFRYSQNAHLSAAFRYEKFMLHRTFYSSWQGVDCSSATESIKEHGVAARLATPKDWLYDCWVPDPEFDGCSMHMLIHEGDMISRYMNYKGLGVLVKRTHVGVSEFVDMAMADKIKYLTDEMDILEFYGIDEGPDAVPIEDIKLVKKVTKDIYRVRTIDDIF